MGIKLKHCTGPCDQEKMLSEFWKDSKQPDGYSARCSTCVRDAREDRRRRREAGEVVPTVTELERQRRSDRAKELVKQGKFGGSTHGALGGRPSHRRPISGNVLDHFRERPQLVIRAIESNLKSRRKSDRMRAAEMLVRLEQEDSKQLREEQGGGKAPEEMSPEELRNFVEAGLRRQLEEGKLDISQFADITLASSDVVEVQT